MKRVYMVNGYIDDMGSFQTRAKSTYRETVEENALWSFNKAREHDHLKPMTIEQFKRHIRHGNVKFTEIHD